LKSTLIKYSFAVGFVFFLIACSVKKDKFISRNFHAVTTEYNVLYNGNIALDKGLEELKATYQDNFWEVLPIERTSEKAEITLPEPTKNQNFEGAEEKAVKAIQKHSMNIAGTEKNPQMDEAYLLLAKARYYQNRFIPALEALNYILYKYPLSDRIYHAKVWREKVNIRLDNEDVAIKNLKRLLKDKKIKGQDLADANAMLAQAYMNIQVKDTAIAALKIAKEATNNNEEKARYTFILGQLYENLQYNDSAYSAFQEVINMNRKAPRRYVVQSHAKQALQFDFKNGDTLVFVEKFNTLLEDRENRPFLDVLNHQIGIFYDKQGLNSNAKTHYNKSIKILSKDKYLAASNYRNLGEIFFREADYKTAGKYYDSTLLRLDDRTREHRKIKKKRDNLEDVIKYEAIAQQNDSILNVVAMNDLERATFYENYISKLKIDEEKKAKLAEENAKKEANITASSSNNMPIGKLNAAGKKDMQLLDMNVPSAFSSGKGLDKSSSNFYFYNPATVAFGRKEFQSRWGKRALKDNWRRSSELIKDVNIISNDSTDSDQNDAEIKKEQNPKYQTEFYLSQIPTDQNFLDSLAKDRNFAYYQLGFIYKEKFKEYPLAASRLEQLLKNNPEERLVLPSMYSLYKIYQQISPLKAEEIKQTILAQYPNSRYAQILNHPEVEITDNENPELVFNTLYKKFESNQIREVLVALDEAIFNFTGEESLPKFEMLKAKAVARLKGVEEYKKALNFVALTYPNVEEGKQAEKMIQTEIPLIEALDFGLAPTGFKIIFPKKFPYEKEVKNGLEKIAKYIKDTNAVVLKASEDIYNLNNNFIVIHGFDDKEAALSVLSVLQMHKSYKMTDKSFIISTEDYKIVQMKKKLEEWILLNK